MTKDLTESGRDLTQKFCYDTEECPGRNSNLSLPEYESQTLRLRQSVRSNEWSRPYSAVSCLDAKKQSVRGQLKAILWEPTQERDKIFCLNYSSAIMMEVIRSYETWLAFQQAESRYRADNRILQHHHCENLKSSIHETASEMSISRGKKRWKLDLRPNREHCRFMEKGNF